MSTQNLLNPSIVTKETLDILANNLVLASRVNRKFERQFGMKIGSSLTIRKPNRFKVTYGPGLALQDINEAYTSITLSTWLQQAFEFTDSDLALTVEEFSERYIKPAAENLANEIDLNIAKQYVNIYNLVGTPGTLPASFAAIDAVAQRMDELAVTQSGRTLVLGPAAYHSVAQALVNTYTTRVSESAYKGFLVNLGSLDIFLDQNIVGQTVGAYAGTPVVNGAGQTGASLVTNGWSNSIAGLLNVGDVFTIAGVYAINPQNRQQTTFLQNFVVTATAASDGSGNSTLSISPSIVTTGPYQNVSGSPANGAAISVKGNASTAYGQNLGFTKDTFAFVTVPLEVPNGTEFAKEMDYKGISIRIIRDYDINNAAFPCRMDILCQAATIYPETGVRLTN